ncbi:Profilin A [Histomonas meleagridis]|nr:Profilin A [Histomonas meleagridis]
MSGWNAYLADVKDIAAGCAIISLQGALCGKEGKWDAKQAEMQNYAACLNNIASAQSKGITYNGKKYIIVRAVDDPFLHNLVKKPLFFKSQRQS